MIDIKWVEKKVPDKIISVRDFKKFIIIQLDNMKIRIDKKAVRQMHKRRVQVNTDVDNIMQELEEKQDD